MGAPTKKKVAPMPAATKKAVAVKTVANPLYEKRARVHGTGNSLPAKTPLNRYVKWPKYVRIQRQRKVLMQRLKVPPAINQFSKCLDKNLSENLFKILNNYRPETKAEKKARLVAKAQAEASGKSVDGKKPVVVKFGINHVTQLVEQGKAQLVVIANDVDPLELVVWLPALCRKMNVPYCIVKGKARLGTVVNQKTATALCVTAVKNEDKHDFGKVVDSIKVNFSDRFEQARRQWGGGIMGFKAQAIARKKQRVLDLEAAKRA